MIRKRDLGEFTTATLATVATHGGDSGTTVARIATVAVANDAPRSFWLLHYRDCDAEVISYSPAVTHAEVMARYPNAIAADPYTPVTQKPDAPVSTEDEAAILGWLAHIGEAASETIAEVMAQCQGDAGARSYYLGRANFCTHRAGACE
jgi:hypothetical protein